MSQKYINYVGQLFKCEWEELKNKFNLKGQLQKNTFYSKILEKCTYSKLRENQKSGFPRPSLNKKLSNLLSPKIE